MWHVDHISISIYLITLLSNILNNIIKQARVNWDIDSSFSARKALATELGCPADLMGDSARMNMWLHKTVLQKIANNGGNVPKDLLD